MMKQIAIGCMVKNEGHIIERCLESILRLEPELVVITDTGSSDNTIMKAGLFLQKHKIPFRIYQETFIDFAFNRSLLLKYIQQETNIDYVLMLDADDIIEYHPSYTKDTFRLQLVGQVYNVEYKDQYVTYHLPKLTSNKVDLSYIGVTHEYLHNLQYKEIILTGIWTRQFNDSFRRQNHTKHLNDIQLINKVLKTTVDNGLKARYYFYLGQAYLAIGEIEDAIKAYQQRIFLGGWPEEIFYSHYQLGKIYETINMDKCVYHYIKAYLSCKHRAESLYNLQKYLEHNKMPIVSMMLNLFIKEIKCPISGLFLEPQKYGS